MITIYSTQWCTYCKRAKEYFDSINEKYTEYDVGEDEEKAAEMVEKTGQLGVPVIDIDGTVIIGFDKQAIDKALKK